ncbi:MAG TPA: phosphoribulokinase [Gammaproteobacteria bacterium]|nr:phosphoribulokinase [Gammaproteobacteria bacterium]|tara:strand:+ start:330 stop:1223 length:894 start_codon:yes stop_codon:yes gene_type:complete
MSILHPIVAVTGSSGAGTSSVKLAFERIFQTEGIKPAIIEGDSFHRYDRTEMEWEVEKSLLQGRTLTHFGPEGNLLKELEELFSEFATYGTGKQRSYVHTEEEAERHGSPPGTFTDWQPLMPECDLLFYEGLHGGLITKDANIAKHVDLLIGVVPIINLEWMQKIHRDRSVRGYSADAATDMILRRMPDYVHYICPQFSRTDVNFQRVPTIDTSNPFTATEIPSNDESMVVIHIANQSKIRPRYQQLLEMLNGAFMSRPDTIVVPAGKYVFAMELLLSPIIEALIERRNHPRIVTSS